MGCLMSHSMSERLRSRPCERTKISGPIGQLFWFRENPLRGSQQKQAVYLLKQAIEGLRHKC